MRNIVRRDYYFDAPGPKNTPLVIKAVSERVEESGIKTIVVASTSGKTALAFANALKGKVNVIGVSYQSIDLETHKKLGELGAIIEENCPILFSKKRTLRETLYLFGQGLKVACEAAVIAVEREKVKPYQDIIAVGGTDRGADTAIIVRATKLKEILWADVNRRLEIREIIAMPRKKKWWT